MVYFKDVVIIVLSGLYICLVVEFVKVVKGFVLDIIVILSGKFVSVKSLFKF